MNLGEARLSDKQTRRARAHTRKTAHVLLIGLLLAVSLQGLVSGQGQGALADLVWPAGNYSHPSDRPALADRVLESGANESLVFGTRSIERFEIERLEENRSRVTFRQAGQGNVSIVEHHEPHAVGGSDDDNSTLWIRPEQLRRSRIEVSKGIRVIAPATKIALNDGNVSGRSRTARLVNRAARLGDAIGLPPHGFPSDPGLHTEWRIAGGAADPHDPGQQPLTTPLYLAHEACVDAERADCGDRLGLGLVCRNCTKVRGWVRPDPGGELTEVSGGQIEVGSATGLAVLFFDSQDHLVYAGISPAYDLNESAVMDPVDARDLVIDDIHQRGYRLGGIGFDEEANASYLDQALFSFELAEGRVEPVGARFVWQDFDVLDPPEEGSDDPYGDDLLARYVQDARTGEIIEAEFRPGSVTAGPDNPLPAPGLGLVLAAGAAAALAWRRWS